MDERRVTAPDTVNWVGPMGAAEAILMNMTMDGRLPVGRCSHCRQVRIMATGWELLAQHPESDRRGAIECPGSGLPPEPLTEED